MDAEKLLSLAGVDTDRRVWEIQPEDGAWLVLLMGNETRTVKRTEAPADITVAEVPAAQCEGLIRAAFYAKRKGVSLGRLMGEG